MAASTHIAVVAVHSLAEQWWQSTECCKSVVAIIIVPLRYQACTDANTVSAVTRVQYSSDSPLKHR